MTTTDTPNSLDIATELVALIPLAGLSIRTGYRGSYLLVRDRGDRAVMVSTWDNQTTLAACTLNEVFDGPTVAFTNAPTSLLVSVAMTLLGA